MHVKVVFSSLMHTALGSHGEGVQGSGTGGREERGEMLQSLSMQLLNSNHYSGCQSMAIYCMM